MKSTNLIFLLVFLLTSSCNSQKTKEDYKTGFKPLKKAQLLIDFDNDDLPSGINIEYSNKKNFIYIGPLFSEGNLSSFFLKFNITNKNSELYGYPGQDETNTQFYESLGMVDNGEYLFLTHKGWIKFFDLNGRFLYSIYSPSIQNGDAMFLQDKLISFPSWLNPANKYLLSYIPLEQQDKGGVKIKLKKFLTLCFEKPKKQKEFQKNLQKEGSPVIIRNFISPIIAKKLNEKLCAILLVKKNVNNLIYYDFFSNKLTKINFKRYILPFTRKRFLKKFALANSLDTLKGDVFVGINLLLRTKYFGNRSPFCYLFLRFDNKGELKGIYTHPIELYPQNQNSILLDFEVAKMQGENVKFIVNEWVTPVSKRKQSLKIKKEKRQRIIIFEGLFFKNIEQIKKQLLSYKQ